MSKKFSLYSDRLDLLDQDSLLEYKEVLSRYPYCQYAQLMFLLNLKKLGDEDSYHALLSRVAISVPDRERLKLQVENVGTSGRLSVDPVSPSRPVPPLPREERIPWTGNRRQPDAQQPSASVVKPGKPKLPPISEKKVGRPVLKKEKPVSDPETRRERQIRQIGFVPVVEETKPQADSPRHIDVEQLRAMLHGGHVAKKKDVAPNEPLAGASPESAPVGSGKAPGPVVGHPLMAAVRHAAGSQAGNTRLSSGELIDRFLQGGGEHPIRIDENFDYSAFDPDQGGSSVEDFSFGTETLAEMYLKSHTPEKAIAVYEHLRLKFPEKSSYFAELIRKVKKDYSIK